MWTFFLFLHSIHRMELTHFRFIDGDTFFNYNGATHSESKLFWFQIKWEKNETDEKENLAVTTNSDAIKWIENAADSTRLGTHSKQSVKQIKMEKLWAAVTISVTFGAPLSLLAVWLCRWCLVAARKLKNIMQIFFCCVRSVVGCFRFELVLSHPFSGFGSVQIHGLEIGSMRIIVDGIASRATHTQQYTCIFPTAKLKSIHFNSIDDCFVTTCSQTNGEWVPPRKRNKRTRTERATHSPIRTNMHI